MRTPLRYLVYAAMGVLLAAPARAQAPEQADAQGGAQGGARDFVTGVEDLPLIAGLTEQADAGVVFDKPSGRIVEAYATGALTRAEVVAFYVQTLPELGWRRLGDMAFARESEVLRIVVSGDDGALTVRFSLSPR